MSRDMTTVNLTALAETRKRMTLGPDFTLTADYGEIVDRDDDVIGVCEDSEDAAGLVVTHNAADVLIEVARAGILLQAASAHRNEMSKAGHFKEWTDSCRAEGVAQQAYDLALAKVSL